MRNQDIKELENVLEVKRPEITREQLQAVYALNLCSVSVSQIIDYNDINVLDQEYESILNNLNLEYMPKDEALLDILKRILETITFFRIQEGDRSFIEKDYQKKVKNAIWSAMPNPGALVATGLSGGGIGAAISIAATVGTAYMNYRKTRADLQFEKERKEWELKKTAMEQFQSLQQQLFETSWRLADKYKYWDALRLSEKQIKQYNLILEDSDEIRKFERLNSIKHKFAAYPPFWYFFGNTANSIALSEHYGLENKEKDFYRSFAKKCFEYFTIVNEYDLLREDGIAASCYMEYVDLLDAKQDGEKIRDLICKAVEAAGNSLDVLQLCAIAYMKIGDTNNAKEILRQLVNEKYNEVTNAQLLSSIYVNDCIQGDNIESMGAYKLLGTRLSPYYLYTMPENLKTANKEQLQSDFIKTQQSILKTKYKLVLIDFIKKYEIQINKIIPIPEDVEKGASDEVYENKEAARIERINQVKMALYGSHSSERYKSVVQNIPYSYCIFEILNKMFSSICMLDCVLEQHKQLEFQDMVKKAIVSNGDKITKIDESIKSFDKSSYVKIQEVTLRSLTNEFFLNLAKEITTSVDSKTEMSDFAIAETSLSEFCKREGFEEPETLFEHKDDAQEENDATIFFTPDLIGGTVLVNSERIKKNKDMISAIKGAIDKINITPEQVEFYTQTDPRMNRYFYGKALQKYKNIRAKTLAVLDDRSKGDMDLLFTTEGIMPIIKGRGKSVVAYDKIHWSKNANKKELIIGVKYSNDKIDMDALFDLIEVLSINESKIDNAGTF